MMMMMILNIAKLEVGEETSQSFILAEREKEGQRERDREREIERELDFWKLILTLNWTRTPVTFVNG